MIFPISHERSTARRWPIVTTIIVAVCLAVMLVLQVTDGPAKSRAAQSLIDAVVFYRSHPYLQPKAPLDARVLQAPPPEERPAEEVTVEEQRVLDRLCANAGAALAAIPSRRFGYVPNDNGLVGLVTYAFLHAGWLHFIFNMWFLWLCGCNLEDRWGRPAFAVFYGMGGVAAGLAHKIANVHSQVPLVGASGAIAAAMGAFLVLFAHTRIRFAYFIMLRLSGTFFAPAYVMLPLWLVQQVFSAMTASSSDSTAYAAHIGGFLFGVAVAAAMKASGWDQKLDEAVDGIGAVNVSDPRMLNASRLIDEGKLGEAEVLLRMVAADRPNDVGVALELLRAAKLRRDPAAEGAAYGRAMRAYLDADMADTARQLEIEARAAGCEPHVPAYVRLRLADALAVAADRVGAERLYASIAAEGVRDVDTARAALGASEMNLAMGRRDAARAWLTQVVESQRAPAAERARAATELERLGPAARAAADSIDLDV